MLNQALKPILSMHYPILLLLLATECLAGIEQLSAIPEARAAKAQSLQSFPNPPSRTHDRRRLIRRNSPVINRSTSPKPSSPSTSTGRRPQRAREQSSSPQARQNAHHVSSSSSDAKSSDSSEGWIPPRKHISTRDWNRSPVPRRGPNARQTSSDSPRSASPRVSSPKSERLEASRSPSKSPDIRMAPSLFEHSSSGKRRSMTRSSSPRPSQKVSRRRAHSFGPPLPGGSPSPSDPKRMEQIHTEWSNSVRNSPVRVPSPLAPLLPASPFPLRLDINPAEVNAAINRANTPNRPHSPSGSKSRSSPTSPSRTNSDKSWEPEISARDVPENEFIAPPHMLRRRAHGDTPGGTRSRSQSPGPRPHMDPVQLQRLSGRPHEYLRAANPQSPQNAVGIIAPVVPPIDQRLPLDLYRPQRQPLLPILTPRPIVRPPGQISPISTPASRNGGGLWSSADSTPVQSRPSTPRRLFTPERDPTSGT